MKDNSKFINKAIKLLRKVGIKEPYYVKIKNQKGGYIFKKVKNKGENNYENS